MIRVGLGFDAHPFADGRRLMLGCVPIEHPRGLAGHSDGDVLAHAICDAALGAAGLGDLGTMFPADPSWEGASGAVLLGEVARRVVGITWVDATVICEEPRVSPLHDEMRAAIAAALGMFPAEVSVKATTTDGMGFAGRGEGIAAMAVVTLET